MSQFLFDVFGLRRQGILALFVTINGTTFVGITPFLISGNTLFLEYLTRCAARAKLLFMNQAYDYRTLLKDCFAERRRANPVYSLRAFARDLDMSPGRLSKILSHKQGLSLDVAKLIVKKLGLSEAESTTFFELVKASDGRSRSVRAQAQLDLAEKFKENFQVLEEDEFHLISDWYHYALMDLSQMPGFKSEPKWLAQRLGISVTEVEVAVERLLRLKIFEDKAGKLVCKNANITTTRDVPSQSVREFHRQIINKALRALSEQGVEERDFSAVTFSLDTRLIPVLKDKIEKMRREISSAEAALSSPKTKKQKEVYCLAIQLFRLSEKEKI